MLVSPYRFTLRFTIFQKGTRQFNRREREEKPSSITITTKFETTTEVTFGVYNMVYIYGPGFLSSRRRHLISKVNLSQKNFYLREILKV